MTSSVAVATVVATVVAAFPAVAKLLLLGTEVGVVVKVCNMQTAPTLLPAQLEGNGPPPDSRRSMKHWAFLWPGLLQ